MGECGVALLSAYATKRWSCLQRLKPGSLQLTADAVRASSWKQKSKRKRRLTYELTYCACRQGIELSDWGGIWFDVRARYAAHIDFDLAGADFLAPAVVRGRIGAAT